MGCFGLDSGYPDPGFALWPEGGEGSREGYLENPQPGAEVDPGTLDPDDYPQVPVLQP
jgi:hypothetical protein